MSRASDAGSPLELSVADYRGMFRVLEECEAVATDDNFRGVALEAISRHLGYRQLTFFLGRHPAGQLSLHSPEAIGVPDVVLDRYLRRYAAGDVFGARRARRLLRLQGYAALPAVLDSALEEAQRDFLSGFVHPLEISDKIVMWLDTELPVHGYIGVIRTDGERFNPRDHRMFEELRPHLTYLLRSRVTATSGWPGYDRLSAREREVSRLVADGCSNVQIARQLLIGEDTVKKHVTHILAKCGLRSRTQLAILWHKHTRDLAVPTTEVNTGSDSRNAAGSPGADFR